MQGMKADPVNLMSDHQRTPSMDVVPTIRTRTLD
jgi:hypothetical protein